MIKNVMVPKSEFQTVSPHTSALEALALMHQPDANTLLVVEENRLVGILTANDLFKIISLKLELEEQMRR